MPAKKRCASTTASASSSASVLVSASATVGAPAPEEILVAKLSRETLERLILASVRGRQPVMIAQLEEAQRAAAASPPPAPVAEDISMEGAGPFSLLSPDLIGHILQHNKLAEKLSFSICVCKGLRPLRSVEALWSRLETAGWDASPYEDVRWINAKGFVRLAQWLPDRNVVRDLHMHATKGTQAFAPDDVSAAVSLFPDVERLTIIGQAVVKKVWTDLGKTSRPHLRHLTVDVGTVGAPTILSVFKACPALLSFSCTQLSRAMLDGLASTQRAHRHGGTPLLTSLRQTSRYSNKLSVFDAMDVGRLFPELNELVIGTEMYGPSPALPAQPLAGRNLRRLHVHNLVCPFGDGPSHLDSSALHAVVALLLKDCPRLEALSLAHGRKYVSRNELLPPLPRLYGAFDVVRPPASLVLLHLQDMLVSPEDFGNCELPNLCFLRLVGCGARAAVAGASLVGSAIAPRLRTDGVVTRGLADDYLRKLPDETPNKARVWAGLYRYPQEDLGGLGLSGVLDALERGYRRWGD